MEPNQEQTNPTVEPKQKHPVFCVTPFSKYLAMAVFIVLPFLGGWIGYTYAPEKTIEKTVVKEVEVSDATNTVENIVDESNGLPAEYVLGQEVQRSYLLHSPETGESETIQLYDGDVREDSLLMSPDGNFVSFFAVSCAPGGGCEAMGTPMVLNLENAETYKLEFVGDEDIVFLRTEADAVAPPPPYVYGSVKEWDDAGRLMYEVTYNDSTYTYRSASTTEPWILAYEGMME